MEPKSPKKIRINYARVITAFLIVVIVLGAIALGNMYIALFLLLVNVLGARELCFVLEEKKTLAIQLFYVILSVIPFAIFWFFKLDFGTNYLYILLFSALLMFFLTVNLWFKPLNYHSIRHPFALLYWGLPFSLASYFLLCSGVDQSIRLASVILLIWTSDTMAYFTGKAFGKNKLFPSVSPGKTIEGSTGAGIFCLIVGVLFALALDESILNWAVVAILVWVLGTLGDLVESKMKRVQNVKDSGSILPGHGGLLDRFDSLVLLIPFLLLIEYYLRS